MGCTDLSLCNFSLSQMAEVGQTCFPVYLRQNLLLMEQPIKARFNISEFCGTENLEQQYYHKNIKEGCSKVACIKV